MKNFFKEKMEGRRLGCLLCSFYRQRISCVIKTRALKMNKMKKVRVPTVPAPIAERLTETRSGGNHQTGTFWYLYSNVSWTC